jgi:hypothetical protein
MLTGTARFFRELDLGKGTPLVVIFDSSFEIEGQDFQVSLSKVQSCLFRSQMRCPEEIQILISVVWLSRRQPSPQNPACYRATTFQLREGGANGYSLQRRDEQKPLFVEFR